MGERYLEVVRIEFSFKGLLWTERKEWIIAGEERESRLDFTFKTGGHSIFVC